MKDVYEDLSLLEQYISEGIAQEGVALVLNVMDSLVKPKSKGAKCWDYDISDGISVGPKTLNTPIGGKSVNISLSRTYIFNWVRYGQFWFLEAQGKKV